MPTVNGKKYPYTSAGIKAAKDAAKKVVPKKDPKKMGPVEGSKKKRAVSTTGARVYSRYGKEVPVGNPGAGVFQRKNVVSDFIKGAKAVKSKYVN